jgi:GTP 3',8-cyclase
MIDGPESAFMTSHAHSLFDSFGRVHNNLRISVTDRCNIRCVYCMPEAVEFLPRQSILSFEEIERFVRVATTLGIDKVRLTGGEPLVRRELPKLVAKLAAIPGVKDLGLTTNGILLAPMARALWDAGLRRINVSLDTMDPAKFQELTRRTGFEQVIEGILAARAAGFDPVKVNAVAIKGVTEDDVVPLGRFAREHGLELRFIEYMPLDADNSWERDKVVPAADMLQRIDSEFPLVPEHGPEPATTFRFADGAPGAIGVIASVTEPFCDTCNRLRLTSDGQFRSCLFSLDEVNLRDPMRAGATDDELAGLIRDGVWRKWEGHRINHPDFVRPGRSMSMIGG